MPKLKKAPAPTPPPSAVPEVPIHLKVGLTVAEAAELSGIGATMLRQRISEGRLRVVRNGRSIIIPRAELDRYLAKELVLDPFVAVWLGTVNAQREASAS